MHLFYAPNIDGTIGSNYLLNEEESKHCIRVLRLSVGDTIHVTNGKGTLFRTLMVQARPKACLLQIEERFDHRESRPYYVHLAVSPTKSPERYEWMVEKAAEVGVDEITPLIAARSERKTYNIERAERIAISAMKQSLKTYLPIIQQTTSFTTFINRPFEGVKLIAHCGEGFRKALNEVLTIQYPRYLILIGPEGDFSPDEVACAEVKGFQSIHLGSSRLRSETAGLMAVMALKFIHF